MTAERPTFDEVSHGYDPRQVDDYLASLWRYASEVTARAAAAEAALDRERKTRGAKIPASRTTAETGNRIGLMLALAQQEADEITDAARRIAERALAEAVDDAASRTPIVAEARDQADRLLLDAYEEAERRTRAREEEINARIGQASARLEAIRHQQGEILGALLRLRGLLTSDEIDRSLSDLARAAADAAPGAAPGPDGFAGTGGFTDPGGFTAGGGFAAGDGSGTGGFAAAGGFAGAQSRTTPPTRPPHHLDDDIIDAEVVEE